MKSPIKVLIVDEFNLVRDGVKLILESDENIQVCGKAKDLHEAFELIRERNPDVVLLELKLPDGDGISGCINIKNLCPKIKVIILTTCSKDHVVAEAIRAGADGFLLKNVKSNELIENIKDIYQGHSILDTSVSEGIFNKIIMQQEKLSSEENNLSTRETHILQMISLGKANKEIAQSLAISEKTVRNYISNIFKKLNVSNRTEAASYWIRKENM